MRRIPVGVAIERIVINLPPGYDPGRHERALPGLAAKKGHGEGWRVENTDPGAGTATLVRERTVSEVVAEGSGGSGALRVRLAAGTKPSDGDRVAARYADQFPGFYLTEFEPFLGYAILAKLTDDEVRARGQLALALSVKPWQVRIKSRPDGGFTAKLPVYVPSKHGGKLAEAAELIGRAGWYVTVNEKTLVAEVVPSDPPTFPPMLRLDVAGLGAGDVDVTPFAVALPAPGQEVGEMVAIDWRSAHGFLLGGLPGSGKFCVHDTPVPVPLSATYPSGWARHGDLVPGDVVVAVDGSLVEVLSVSAEQVMDCAVVVFCDGQSVTVGVEHLWTVTRLPGDAPATDGMVLPLGESRRVRSLAATVAGQVGSVDAIAGLAGADPGEIARFVAAAGIPSPGGGLYPVDEVLAMWAEHRSRFGPDQDPVTVIRSTAQLLEDVAVGARWAVAAPGPVEYPPADLDVDPYVLGVWLAVADCGVDVDAVAGDLPAGVTDLLAGLPGGDAVAIPDRFLRAGVEQRLALLRGLMDVAGEVTDLGWCVLRLPGLVEPATSLIRSLGMVARPAKEPGAVVFSANRCVFERASMRAEQEERSGLVSRLGRLLRIVEVRPVPAQPARCILVDHPLHQYLVADHVPTHNTVTLNAIAASQLAAGAELVVVDTLDKSVDFEWLRPYVRDGGWGCASLPAAVTALSLVYEEGQRRAELLRRRGVKNWLDLGGDRFAPVTVIVDEVAALLTTDRMPPGVDKSNPEVQEIIETNRLRFKLFRLVAKIIAEQRFVGVRVVLSSQITNQSTGLPPSLKGLLGHKALQGLNPSPAARRQGFDDDTAVPRVPANVAADPNASRGVGAAHLAAQKPVVFKSLFSTDAELGAALEGLGLRRSPCPEPTAEQIARYVYPSEEEGEGDSGPVTFGSGDMSRFMEPVVYGGDGKPLRGAAAAAALVLCPSCDEPIRENGECGCS